jgi:zinc protease
LPLDYLEVFNDRVMAVTREQIIDAFQRRVSPDAMVTVIVGGDS